MTQLDDAPSPAAEATACAPVHELREALSCRFDAGRAVVRLKRESVKAVSFTHASAAERPILEGAFGLLVTSGGSWLAWRAGSAVWDGVVGSAMPLMAGGAGIAVVFGLVALVRAIRKTDVLLVVLQDGSRRKLSLAEPLTSSAKERFASELRALGWNFE
jgi:hypothetical protein